MPRKTKAVTAKSKHKKILAKTKGQYGARSRLYKTAKQANIKSLQYAFWDRKNKKWAFRSLWITRINAALSDENISYSKFLNMLNAANIKLNRKILSDIAYSEPEIFKKIVDKVRI